MNILYLPNNVASMPALTAIGISKHENVNVKVISLSSNKYTSGNEFVIPLSVSRRKPLHWLINKLTFKRKIEKLLRWADVVHYFWGPIFPDYWDLELCFKLKKPIFIEWVGSDIRNPTILSPINSFYERAYRNGYEYAEIESEKRSMLIQCNFASFNAIPILSHELLLYLNKDLFPNFYGYYQRQNVKEFIPIFPDIKVSKPLIIHSPSAPIAKGTQGILEVIDSLKKEYDFEFRLVNGVSRKELLQIMAKADIYIDQMVCGSYGMAATEAMSLGKPVLCYIMPEVYQVGLDMECPIINGDINSLRENLIKLIESPVLRNKIGRASREFAEKYHDTDTIADYLVSIYTKEIRAKKL